MALIMKLVDIAELRYMGSTRHAPWKWASRFLDNNSDGASYMLLEQKGRFRECLRHRWIYIIGDSSLRLFRRELLLFLRHEFNNTSLGLSTDPFGGCGTGLMHCFRENVDLVNGLRVIYSWQTYADHEAASVPFFVTPHSDAAETPDLFIFTSGAWDTHDRGPETYDRATDLVITNLEKTLEDYPSALVLAMTTVACHPYQYRSLPWNALLRPKLQKINSPRFSVLDREPSTINLSPFSPDNPASCEGFHPQRDVSLGHLSTLLHAVCLQ